MTRAGFPSALRTTLWAECALTMTLLDNILLTPQTSTSSYEQFYKHTSKISQELRVFGEIGIVKTDYNHITTKLKNKGEPMIFAGYCMKHGSHVYRMFNLRTHGISVTRDIIWLGLTFGEWSSQPECTAYSDAFIDSPFVFPCEEDSQPAVSTQLDSDTSPPLWSQDDDITTIVKQPDFLTSLPSSSSSDPDSDPDSVPDPYTKPTTRS